MIQRSVSHRRKSSRGSPSSWGGLWVVSPEDLVIQKIRAQRPQDLIDSVSIVEEQQGRLDEEHLDLWARRLGVHQELGYILRGGKFGQDA
ncbi:MAG: hypothetical protein HYY64_07305 [Candidatus Rokubacteria bacterium]|nr:hypothetical protein [Candidatus Rokubacteria bacterium]